MRLLLDTRALRWWITDAESLSEKARDAISNVVSNCFFSEKMTLATADAAIARYDVKCLW